MKTHAKQTGKLNGSSSLMALGILFFTALPLISVEAGNDATLDNNPSTDQILSVEPWMLTLADWNTSEFVAEGEKAQRVEGWMLTPENWDNDLQIDFADKNDTDLEPVDDWMFEPTGWRNDFGGLAHEVVDYDLLMFPLYL